MRAQFISRPCKYVSSWNISLPSFEIFSTNIVMQTGWRWAADLGFVLLIPTQPYLNKSRRVKLFKISQMSPLAVGQHKTTMAINVRALITFFNGPAPNKERNGNQIPSASPVPSQPLLFSVVFFLCIFSLFEAHQH